MHNGLAYGVDEDKYMATQSICIHGHFYQPPREDPRLGVIPSEVGAAPYRNWNERIHAECYEPNAKLGNFERLSFNVGPTLFGWMEHHDPDDLSADSGARSGEHDAPWCRQCDGTSL